MLKKDEKEETNRKKTKITSINVTEESIELEHPRMGKVKIEKKEKKTTITEEETIPEKELKM
jgi:hypothetical protein